MPHHKRVELLVLSSSLLQPIKTFLQFVDQVFFPFYYKTLWLLYLISSSKLLWKKVVFTSICLSSRFKLATNLNATLMGFIFTIRDKISSKSTPFFYPKPLTTNQALYFASFPLLSIFNLNTHLFFNVFLPFRKLYQLIGFIFLQEIHHLNQLLLSLWDLTS